MKNNKFLFLSVLALALLVTASGINALTPQQQQLLSQADPAMLADQEIQHSVQTKGYKDTQDLVAKASKGDATAYSLYSHFAREWPRIIAQRIERSKPQIPYGTEDNDLTRAAQNGTWFARPDGWTSLHETLQACETWYWGPKVALEQAKKIIADAKTKKGDINSALMPNKQTPLDIAKQYCKTLIPELQKLGLQ